MTRKFILLDHSIEDSSGHYLEYARRVLGAAKTQGFKTVLGVNKRADNIVCTEADAIEKSFSRTYWQNQSRRLFDVIKGAFVHNIPTTCDVEVSEVYAEELCDTIDRVGAKNGDLVFLPTLGAVELLGISFYLSRKAALALGWHLLFRRDLPIQTSMLRPKAYYDIKRLRHAISKCKLSALTGTFFFYTDTEELSLQYNHLGLYEFSTLPVPVDAASDCGMAAERAPLIISYLGDAREEKGIHRLPALIDSVRAAGIGEDKVRFRVQINLPNTGRTMRAVRARSALVRRQGVGLEVVEGPFDTTSYHELIRSSDIILLPYKAKNYQARSSGIFSEALAAGIPTIYPRGSWMDKCQAKDGSLSFDNDDELISALLKLLSSYSMYKSISARYANVWREQHSASRLVRLLVNRHFDYPSPDNQDARRDDSGTIYRNISCN